jgi:hypothetical protein
MGTPVFGRSTFLPALVAALGIDFGGLGITPLTPPANLAPLVIAVWMVVGVILLFYLRARDPDRITETGRIFVDESESDTRAA